MAALSVRVVGWGGVELCIRHKQKIVPYTSMFTVKKINKTMLQILHFRILIGQLKPKSCH